MRIRFFALAALALLLGACTQDEAGFLPEGACTAPQKLDTKLLGCFL